MQTGVREYLNELFKWMETESMELRRVVVHDDVLTVEVQWGKMSVTHAITLMMLAKARHADVLPVVVKDVFKQLQAACNHLDPSVN